ncbi:MAG: hypothetical protein HY876_05815 [Coriobacteriales bacterium]|nr:hypothetical protein [Coriobacteriales bacterium]
MHKERFRLLRGVMAALMALGMTFQAAPIMAAPGDTITTLDTPSELPVEVETELAPAGSLKQAPLWKELVQMLEDPYEPVERRPGFGSTMPDLNVWEFERNVFTDEPLRLRTTDGEISWDKPGFLFDPDQYDEDGSPSADVDTVNDPNAPNVPDELRTVIGSLVATDAVVEIDGDDFTIPDGNLVVDNPDSDLRIPPDGTVVAVPAYINGAFYEYDPETGDREEVAEFETPVNEVDFLRPTTDTAGVPVSQQSYIGRPAGEVLGKALFWDMQVGSDSVQACGTCHFAAGADTRTQNQLNPNHLGGDSTLQVADPNGTVTNSDFPFRKLGDPELPSEGDTDQDVLADSNDVMSSMGVRFREFVDIPAPGPSAFASPVNGVRPLKPDLGNEVEDPIADAFVDPDTGENLRRVEPRNTPTMHSAAFNFVSFWDGRARQDFNGGSVFGASDPAFHVFHDPGAAGAAGGPLQGLADPSDPNVPTRIRFSSLGSQAVGPPLSDFEMSFAGRNWAKIGKKLLQDRTVGGVNFKVTPLANQVVDPNDSVLGPFSNQRSSVGGPVTNAGRPGLLIDYDDLIKLTFKRELWQNTSDHFNGASAADPFDGYELTQAAGAASPTNTNQFSQMEANFSLFFGLSVQLYEELLIPDDSPFDKFMDANPDAANGVGQPGERGTLDPWQVDNLVGPLTMIPDDPDTPWYDGFGPEELFGFDIFAGANLTAALPEGTTRNPIQTNGSNETTAVGSNPFLRTARCMLCHLGPEQTDASLNVSTGSLSSNTEYEFPTPPTLPEATGEFRALNPMMLADEFEGNAPDGIEVEPRDMQMLDDPGTPYDDRIVSVPSAFAFGDQGIYNIGVRPTDEDLSRGGDDPFGWPLSNAATALKNIGGADFEPQDTPTDPTPGAGDPMQNFDPDLGTGGGLFEEVGEGFDFPGAPGYELESINPGLETEPAVGQLPDYLSPWVLPLGGGELHPELDELHAAPNTITEANGGPAIEFPEILFGADLHSGTYNPGLFGTGAPNFGWGPLAPNSQSGVPNNFEGPNQGTWPFANRVGRDGAFKAPQLRNVELTGPYFHTGSYLTLRQVVDFNMRGGDFPVTNAEVRDQHMVDIDKQAFGFGTTRTESNGGPIPDVPFADALPDAATQYDEMPDTNHDQTPEPANTTPEQAKEALVKFLLSLTDSRVKCEKAPFDRPEIFVPIDGSAPDNVSGRTALLADARFRHLPAVGEDGRAEDDCLPSFLSVSRTPVAGDGNDHFDSAFAQAATTLTLQSSTPITVDYGVNSGMSARLTDDNGDPIVGAPITLQRSTNGTTWTNVTNLTTDGNGVASYFSFLMERNMRFRMTYAGTELLAPATSATRVVNCRAFVTVPTIPGWNGRTYRFRGDLKPRHTAGTNVVRLYLERFQGGQWVTRSVVWASASNFSTYSRYSGSTTLPAGGSWRVKARHTDGDHADTWTGYRTFTVN